MDEAVIIIMVKDAQTGFLDKELCSVTVGEFEGLIHCAYALPTNEGGYEVYLKLTCDRELEDWQYEAVFDYYEDATILPFVSSIKEEEGLYNPAWEISMKYDEQIEERIRTLLQKHALELDSVYIAIADKRDDYLNE